MSDYQPEQLADGWERFDDPFPTGSDDYGAQDYDWDTTSSHEQENYPGDDE
jgi:hypothetical protein